MISDLRKPVWRLRRRLCSGITLVAYLAAAIGFPLPTSAAKASQGVSTCGQQVCGCGTVEQCKAGGCCCSHEAKPTTPSCCAKDTPKPAAKSPSHGKQPTPAKTNLRWVVGISALKCQGAATYWITSQAALATGTPLTWLPSWPFCHRVTIIQERSWIITADQLDPPPRLEAV